MVSHEQEPFQQHHLLVTSKDRSIHYVLLAWHLVNFVPPEKQCILSRQTTQTRTSFKISLLAPLKTIVQAFGSLQRVRNVKYSSPYFFISNRPQRVPTSLSCNSSVRFAIVAPTALILINYAKHFTIILYYLAILLVSVLRTLLMTEILLFNKKCCAKSETPFSVITRSGLKEIISNKVISMPRHV